MASEKIVERTLIGVCCNLKDIIGKKNIIFVNDKVLFTFALISGEVCECVN